MDDQIIVPHRTYYVLITSFKPGERLQALYRPLVQYFYRKMAGFTHFGNLEGGNTPECPNVLKKIQSLSK